MNTNRLFAGLLAAVISAGALAVGTGAETVPMEITAEKYAYSTFDRFKDGGLEYTVQKDRTLSVSLYSQKDSPSDIIIPSEKEGMKVTEIISATYPENAFKSIEISENVTTIWSTAFRGCTELETVKIPASVVNLGQSYVDIHLSTERLENHPEKLFADCTSLKEIIVDAGNPYYSSIDGALYNKKGDTLLYLPLNYKESDSAKPSKVSSIKKSASKSTIKLTWNKNEDADSYVVKYSTDKKTWKIKTVKTNSVTLKNLKSGTKYYFRVAAQKDGVTGDSSKVFSVTTKK